MQCLVAHRGEGFREGGSLLSPAKTPDFERAPPLLGEHTAQLLGELGYGDDAVGELERAGVVTTAAAGQTRLRIMRRIEGRCSREVV